jgi:hypothetical protein
MVYADPVVVQIYGSAGLPVEHFKLSIKLPARLSIELVFVVQGSSEVRIQQTNMNRDHMDRPARKSQIILYWNVNIYVSCNMDMWINSNQNNSCWNEARRRHTK